MTAYEKIDKHYKKLQSVSKSWDDAIESAKTKIRRDFNQKRNDLKERHNKMKVEEQQHISDYQRTEMQLNQELVRISQQISSLDTQSMGGPDLSFNVDRRSQQLDQVYNETHKEIHIVLDRHKEKLRRMEQIWAQSVAQEKKLGNLGTNANQTVAPIKRVLEEKNKKRSEAIKELEQIREEIDKKSKELAEIEKKETEEIEHFERKCAEEEVKERNEEMTKFVKKIKESLSKTIVK